MQPQYPTQPPAPQYPQQPQQGYPAQPQPAYPPQHYPQAPAPQYPPQGYGQPQPQYGAPQPQYGAPQPPAAPLPTGSLDTFYQQPSASGGPSFKFQDPSSRQPLVGKSYAGFVARPVTDADVRPQTNNGQVMTFKDGRPKFVMVVPMQVQPDGEFPEGQAGWWVKGQARDELARAMAEAGAPQGAPEAGAFIQVTLVGTRPIPGQNPAYQYRVEYRRPQGAAPAPVAEAPAQQIGQATGAPAMQAAPAQQANFAPAPVVHQATQPMPPAPAPQQPAPVPQPVPAAAPAPAGQGFTPEQQALFAQLTGGQPQA